MRILLSAFACAPHVGSEAGAAWRWAIELARHHEVVVVTDEFRREAIEAELAHRPKDNPRFVFFRPRWLRHVPHRSFWSRLLYIGWQYSLLPFARRLHRLHGFDFVHHLTWGVFRHPSFLGFLGVPFVLGPLGGGEDAPLRLKRSIRGRAKLGELWRTVLNWVAKYSPILWWASSRAVVIFARTSSTAWMLPYGLGKRAFLAQEIGISPREGMAHGRREMERPLHVIFAGRLLAWKGVHFAIAAVAHAIKCGTDIRFSVIGSGPYSEELHQRAKGLGLSVEFIDCLPQGELFEHFRQADCFLFPSLHDSGGTVVLEALSFGLPVICLDLCGPAEFVNEGCGTIIQTTGKCESDIEAALGDALVQLASQPKELTRKSEGALRQAAYFSIDNQVARAMGIISDAVRRPRKAIQSSLH